MSNNPNMVIFPSCSGGAFLHRSPHKPEHPLHPCHVSRLSPCPEFQKVQIHPSLATGSLRGTFPSLHRQIVEMGELKISSAAVFCFPPM